MADLPLGWQAVTDPHGRTYYYDANTGRYSWTRPPPPPPPDPAPPTAASAGPDTSPPSAPPLSSVDSYTPNAYPQQTSSYPPSPGYAPSLRPPQSSAPISAHPPPHSPPDHQGPAPLPRPPSYQSHSQPYASASQSYAHAQSYPTPSQPYPSHPPPYSSHPSHPSPPNGGPSSHPPPYSSHPSHPSPPNGGPSLHPDVYGAPPLASHRPPPPPPPLPGAHGSYGYQPTSQPAYSSQGPYGQQSHDPHGSPPPPPGGYAPHDPHAQPSHGYGRPPYGAPGAPPSDPHAPPSHLAGPGGHPPPPPSSDYGPPPAGHGRYGHVSPSGHQRPPSLAHGPPTQPPPPPPDGYPAAPSQPGQQFLPPHQQSYQPPPPPIQHPSHMSHISTSISSMTAGMSHLSMGMGPNSKVVLIGLEFRAVGLRDRDLFGKSDPVLHVFQPKDSALDQAQVSEWKHFGSTEVVKNTVNPTWADKVKLHYHFERHQPLRFELVDVDNFKTMRGDKLGYATCTLAEIVRNTSIRLPIRQKDGGAQCGELTIRAHDENPTGKVKLQLSFGGKNLDKKDFMGKSDPYYKLSRVSPGSGGTSLLYKSEEKKNDCSPTWKPHTVMIPAGNTPWTQISLAVEVYDWDKFSPHDLIGETAFALSDLIKTKTFPLINKKKQAKKGNRYKNSGELVVHRADAAELPNFISYLQGGLRLDFIVAVDFTASNRPVDNPRSLHYMGDPNHPSQYYQALHAVGTILSGYLADGYITALGFGAKLPGNAGQASFDFGLTGQADARVHGVQGLLQAYQTALSRVILSGPTNFAPIIGKTMDIANSIPVSQTNQHFAVLLIVTDGIISDQSATIDAIIDASHSTPMAIVVVGVGKEDFQAMERLDGDNFKLRNDRGDKVAKHDIVQFTRYDPTKPTEYLAADVLQEVPKRVVEFMTDAGIKPNQPVGQSFTY